MWVFNILIVWLLYRLLLNPDTHTHTQIALKRIFLHILTWYLLPLSILLEGEGGWEVIRLSPNSR